MDSTFAKIKKTRTDDEGDLSLVSADKKNPRTGDDPRVQAKETLNIAPPRSGGAGKYSKIYDAHSP